MSGKNHHPRCKDGCWRDKFSAKWYVPWCPHSRSMRYEDIMKTDKLHHRRYGDYDDGRSINWLRICTKTGKVAVHNKKCDVLEVIEEVKK